MEDEMSQDFHKNFGRLSGAPITGHTGAEIHEVDVAGKLSDQDVAAIRAALRRWKVVVLRGQNLDHQALVDFATRFGEPTELIFEELGGGASPKGFPQVRTFYRGPERTEPAANHGRHAWHTDLSCTVNPPSVTMLYSVMSPPYGGDTAWTNLAAAYEGLSAPIKSLIEPLRAVHDYWPPSPYRASPKLAELLEESPLTAEHSVVCMHPETGERVLFVNPRFTKYIVGLNPRESHHVLEMLLEEAILDEYTLRVRWEPGTLVLWDNRATAHLAATDISHLAFERLLYRTQVAGEIPVGPTGVPSRILQGQPVGVVAQSA
jgi:alpha-ketoglutarate-dependent sulfate ester dioxygenase